MDIDQPRKFYDSLISCNKLYGLCIPIVDTRSRIQCITSHHIRLICQNIVENTLLRGLKTFVVTTIIKKARDKVCDLWCFLIVYNFNIHQMRSELFNSNNLDMNRKRKKYTSSEFSWCQSPTAMIISVGSLVVFGGWCSLTMNAPNTPLLRCEPTWLWYQNVPVGSA